MDTLNPTAPEMGADRSGDMPAAGLPRMAVRVGELGLLLPWDGGREVLPAPAANRIPNTAAWLRGVANVRGALIPVVDLAVAFGVEHAEDHVQQSALAAARRADDAERLSGQDRERDVRQSRLIPRRVAEADPVEQ